MRSRGLIGMLALCMAVGLAGCGSQQQSQESKQVEGLDKLGDILVIAREEGSGTRGAFAQLADFEGTGSDSKQSDLTTEDAQIANDAKEVIEAVEEDNAAIGYVSKGTLTGNESLKTLKVNEISNTEGSKYPLSRSFYLAYTGQLSELEQDFLTYVHGAGQEIVRQSYDAVAKSSSFLSNQSSGTIVINGSTSVAPLMEELASAYMEENPNAQIQVEASDSTQGLTEAMSGNCDFGMSSRDLKDYEEELLDYEAIAKDNIAVVVNEENPLKNITLDELKEIYTGEVTKWDELNK